jgi:Autotransporter beta-domain
VTRKILLIALALFSLPLFAQLDPDRKTGFTFSVANAGGDISVRRLLSPEWAVLGSLGYAEGNAYNPGTPAGPVDFDSWILSAGARRYFSATELRPFAEATLGYQWSDVPGCDEASNARATAGGGVEYAIARRVSIEGSAGLSYSNVNQRCSPAPGFDYEFDQDSFSTFRTALSITFYF